MSALEWVTVLLPLGVFGLVALNLVFWPRGRAEGDGPAVSVLIPARNEALNIEACVRAALRAAPAGSEILVYDDASTDQTPQILQRLCAELPALRVLKGVDLPDGWVGKPHACHRLAEAARADRMVFLDADVLLEPEGIQRIEQLTRKYRADVLTAVPKQITGGFFERLVLPLLHLTYTAWLFLPLIWRSSNPRFLAANGQILAVSRDAYARIGGFSAVRNSIVDDMAFCQRAKRKGARVVFADGFLMARCRMYRSAQEVLQGFSKNIFEGLGASLLGLAVVVLLYGFTFVWPYLGWMFGSGSLAQAAMLAVSVNLAIRTCLAVRFQHPVLSVLLHPLGVLALIGIALNSMRLTLLGRLSWRGRVYPSAAGTTAGGS